MASDLFCLPEDPIGPRSRALIRSIAFATRPYLPRRMSLKHIKQLQAWHKEIEELVQLHMEQADRAIEQLVRNAAEMAARPPAYVSVSRFTAEEWDNAGQARDKGDGVYAGLNHGRPASVPGERG